MACSATTWKAILPRLSERYTVIAPDLLGHGRSAKPRTDYSLEAYASSLRDPLVALGIEILGASNARLVIVPVQDLGLLRRFPREPELSCLHGLQEGRRFDKPGTVSEHPNTRLRPQGARTGIVTSEVGSPGRFVFRGPAT